MAEYREFLNERESFKEQTLIASEITDAILYQINSGYLDLLPGSNFYRTSIKGKPLIILLKSFNNYRKKTSNDSVGIMWGYKDGISIIEIFIFDILSKNNIWKNMRGNKLSDLNNLFIKLVQRNYITHVKETLYHEIQHAVEFFSGIWDKSTKEYSNDISSQDGVKNYVNEPAEINAKIVEYIAQINEEWKFYYRRKVWLSRYPHKNVVNLMTKKIALRIDKTFGAFLTPENNKKIKKAIYTTLDALYDHYYKKSKIREYNELITNDNIKHFFEKNI